MFWLYDFQDSMAYLARVWCRPTSRPVLVTVLGTAAAVTLLVRLTGL